MMTQRLPELDGVRGLAIMQQTDKNKPKNY
jgi:hypothetical protein